MRRTNKSLRGIADKAKRGFKGKAAAVLTSALMGLTACGDTVHNHYYETDGGTPTVNVAAPEVTVGITVDNPEVERSILCSDETEIQVGEDSNSALIDVGQRVVLSNEFSMRLTDIEAETQTAFFDIIDSEGNVVAFADMVEGIEYTLTFPDGEQVSLSACSVRAGYTFNEKSVMLVSDSGLEIFEPEQPQPVCDGDVRIEESTHQYNRQIPDAMQEVNHWYCEGESEYYRETSRFTPDVELELGESGYPTGLPPGRYEVSLLEETYVLADADQNGIALAKESISGIMNQGEHIPVDDLKFRLDDLEAHGDRTGAIISVLDSEDNVLVRDVINSGETVLYNIGGREYHFHIYETAPGYTFGAKWADVAVFSEYHRLEDGGDFNGFSFGMSWTPDRRLSSWTLTRE